MAGGAGNDILYGEDGYDVMDGGTGNDILYSGADDDVLLGGDGEDQLYGGEGDDILDSGADNDSLVGGIGHDILHGGAGKDTLTGSNGNDQLFGQEGNDTLIGGNGNDFLVGAESAIELGTGSIDLFTGGNGSDYFVLGAEAVYYNDGNDLSAGLDDYALVTDFNKAHDIIQLSGQVSHYLLGNSVAGLEGVGIYLDINSNGSFNDTDELIGIVQGTTEFSLSDSAFVYVWHTRENRPGSNQGNTLGGEC